MALKELIFEAREKLVFMQTDLETLPVNIKEHLDLVLKVNYQRGVVRGLEKASETKYKLDLNKTTVKGGCTKK